jgi:hypothetical protein
MVSFGEPANLAQLFDSLEFRVVGQYDGVEALGGGNAKSVGGVSSVPCHALP